MSRLISLKSGIVIGGKATEEYYYPRVTTTDATLTTIDSISIPANGKAYIFTLTQMATKSDGTNTNSGDIKGVFMRASGGNVTKQGAFINTLMGGLSGASATMVANTATQAVDIKLSGINATTIIWDMSLILEYQT